MEELIKKIKEKPKFGKNIHDFPNDIETWIITLGNRTDDIHKAIIEIDKRLKKLEKK